MAPGGLPRPCKGQQPTQQAGLPARAAAEETMQQPEGAGPGAAPPNPQRRRWGGRGRGPQPAFNRRKGIERDREDEGAPAPARDSGPPPSCSPRSPAPSHLVWPPTQTRAPKLLLPAYWLNPPCRHGATTAPRCFGDMTSPTDARDLDKQTAHVTHDTDSAKQRVTRARRQPDPGAAPPPSSGAPLPAVAERRLAGAPRKSMYMRACAAVTKAPLDTCIKV